MKKIMILTKEAQMREQIAGVILSHSKNVHIYKVGTVAMAYQLIMNQNIELLIVDAILDKKNPEDVEGIRFIENIRQLGGYTFVPVILLSTLTDEKLHAYSYLHCYGFLEKPFSREQLSGLIGEALKYDMQKPQRQYIHFRQGGILYPIKIEEIVYIEHRSKKMYVHTTTEELMLPYHTCEATLAGLEDCGFVLCARGVIVNRDYIYALDTTNHYVVLKENRGCLELGRKYYKEIKTSLSSQEISIRKTAKKEMKKEACF